MCGQTQTDTRLTVFSEITQPFIISGGNLSYMFRGCWMKFLFCIGGYYFLIVSLAIVVVAVLLKSCWYIMFNLKKDHTFPFCF